MEVRGTEVPASAVTGLPNKQTGLFTEIVSQFSVHQEIAANLPMQKLISLHQKSTLIAPV